MNKPRTILIQNTTIITLGGTNLVLKNHSLRIADGKVLELGPTTKLVPTAQDELLDGTGKVLLPGFINAHMHFYSSMARGLTKAAPSKDFNEVLQNLWWKLDRGLTTEATYLSAMTALIDSIRKGTTTLIDHHASPRAARGSLDAIARTVLETGLRADLCYEVSDRDGAEVAKQGLDENVAFLKRLSQEGGTSLRGHFGLHASFTVGDETLERAVGLAREFDAGFHVHVAEAESDQVHCIEKYGMRILERFAKFGVLGPKTICAHAVHVHEDEIRLLADTKTSVVHNPQSNMNNAVGVADLLAFNEAGVRVGLGTDAMTVNMLEELRSAIWIQRIFQLNPSVGFMEAVNALTLGNPAIASESFGPELGLGTIAPGNAADLVLMDYHPNTLLDESTFAGHLVFGLAEANVDSTIAQGKILMKHGALQLNLDEERILARSQEVSSELWEKVWG
ncbi:putative aminohydrolase SsnA [Bdellovibrionota bacterium FG-2]